MNADRLLLTLDVAQFLYAEAELLDERRHDEWLALLAEDIRYWMPMRRNVSSRLPTSKSVSVSTRLR